jgi:hypothetical protein
MNLLCPWCVLSSMGLIFASQLFLAILEFEKE